jgi:hypothetical protein
MSDQLAEWQTRLNTVGPISYPEQQALVAEAIVWRGKAVRRLAELSDAVSEISRLREGLNAAGDMLARVMEADTVPDDVMVGEDHQASVDPSRTSAGFCAVCGRRVTLNLDAGAWEHCG